MTIFNWRKPTAQMLGRWQPWHKGHTELFKRILSEHEQVCIMVRDVVNSDAGMGNADNPFDYHDVRTGITTALKAEGFKYAERYIIMLVPNIVNISWGRGVGYTFTEHDLGKTVHDISATKIRAKMRERGELQ